MEDAGLRSSFAEEDHGYALSQTEGTDRRGKQPRFGDLRDWERHDTGTLA